MIESIKGAEKGIYSHPQPQGHILLKEYVLFKENGKRCLILRFANETIEPIDSFEFFLSLIDTSGQVIRRIKINEDNLKFGSNSLYSTKKAIVVEETCADFIVSIISYSSGSYKFKLKKGQYIPYYTLRKSRK